MPRRETLRTQYADTHVCHLARPGVEVGLPDHAPPTQEALHDQVDKYFIDHVGARACQCDTSERGFAVRLLDGSARRYGRAVPAQRMQQGLEQRQPLAQRCPLVLAEGHLERVELLVVD